jgi:hypothetical protein
VNLSHVPFAIFASSNMKDLEEQHRCMKFYLTLEKSFYRDFSDLEASLWRGLSKPHTMLQMEPTFQIGLNVHQRQSQNWTTFHINGQ